MRPGAEFFSRLPEEGRVLVLDLGFLGDTVHLVPALGAIRRALPKARLEVMVADHITEILSLCPWIDAVLGYPRFPKGPRWHQDLGRVRALRDEKYDAVINLNGSDRSSLLTLATRAPLRLGREPACKRWFWPHCFTHTVAVERGKTPIFRQHWEALGLAGFPLDANGPTFPIEFPAQVSERIAGLLGPKPPPYVHVSPFATLDNKELPLEILVNFLNVVRTSHPKLEFVISTAPTAREKGKLDTLLRRLRSRPWRVFPGDLNLAELTCLLRGARLHLGGDSGVLHAALMAGTPTVSWFRDYDGRLEWQPSGAGHIAVVGKETPSGIDGISARHLTAAFDAALSGVKP